MLRRILISGAALCLALGACDGQAGGSRQDADADAHEGVDAGDEADPDAHEAGGASGAADGAGEEGEADGAGDAQDAASAGPADASTDGAMDEDGAMDGSGAQPDAAVNGDSGEAAPAVEQLTVTEPPANRLARWIDYRTAANTVTDVELTCEDAYSARFTGEKAGRSHSVYALGLAADTHCELRVRVDDDVVQTAAFDVVGPSDFPTFEVVTSKPEALQQGWTLLNLANEFDSVPARVAIVDALGRLRWYYELPTTRSGADTQVSLVREGVLACGRLGNDGPFMVGWDGSLLWQPRLGGHHDCGFTDAGETVFRYLADAERCAGEPGAGVVVEVDRETSDLLWDWAICEHYDPANLVADWSHLNAVIDFPGEDALLVSSRNQNALFKVSHASGDILWKLGEDGDFAFDEADAFWGQHAPELQPDGNILLFDNGSSGQRESSRVIEIAYDETAMKYEVVWAYAPSPSRFNPIWGDADRLANGNTLATFGARSTVETSDLYEVDADGTLVWQLRLPVRWGVYRADRIPAQHGFVDQ